MGFEHKVKQKKTNIPQYQPISSISYSQIYEINLNFPNINYPTLEILYQQDHFHILLVLKDILHRPTFHY